MFEHILDGYRGAFKYHGRVRRKAYGIFVAVHTFLSWFVLLPLLLWANEMARLYSPTMATQTTVGLLVVVIFVLAFWLPIISILVRRFHDANISGWYVLFFALLSLALLAVVAAFIKPVPAEGGANRFGPDPRLPDVDQIQKIFE